MQACLWMALAILALFGYDWIGPAAKAVKGWEPLLTVFVLGICYTIGIVIDRAADCVFVVVKPHEILMRSSWIRKHAESAHNDPRMEVLNSENRAVEFLEYIRSRLRIARAAVLNSLLVTCFGILFLVLKTDYASCGMIVCIGSIGGLVALTFLALLGVLEVTFQKRLTQTHHTMTSGSTNST